ncbi:MAG: D-alanyl-D-alanine carboxypeptidase [Hyphomicrobium sp.]|nr:D-alanyl-D-alanine carboxypeptidase [Hyphomicrobium sp.]PPC83269.1 MAG: D-alanyl-D-alanine carboxypeptidase [Hyphomicrobium sp.]
MSSEIVATLNRLVVAFVWFAVHVLLFATLSHAQNAEFTPKAKQAILMDAASGAVLYQFHADELVPPASMSKLMTLAVLFKSIKGGQLGLSDEFLVSEQAWRRGGAPSGTSAMMVPVNTKARLDELIQGIIIQSGNDACIAVAEGMAGTEDAFARIMEAEARKLGLKKSTFRNATGLYHPEHLMTARELAILARHLITEYPDQYRIFSQKEFPYRKHKFVNRNPLLFLSLNVDGLKTGFIKESGYGLVASALQDGRRLIVVVGGLATAADRKDEAQKLLEWGFKSFTEFKLFDAAETVGQARVWGGERMYVSLVGQGDVAVILPRFPANQKLRAEIIYSGPLKAPLKKGDQVAKLRVTSSSSAVNEVPLFASEDVAVAGMMRRGIDSLVHMAFKWVPL